VNQSEHKGSQSEYVGSQVNIECSKQYWVGQYVVLVNQDQAGWPSLQSNVCLSLSS